MANLINQPSSNPTRKLTASVVGGSVWGSGMLVLGLALKNLAPGWYDPEVLASVTLTGTMLASYLSGFFVRDKPNVIVVTQDAEK